MDGNDDAEDERQCDGGDVRAQPCRCRTAVFVVASFFLTFLWQERVQAVVVVVFYVSDRTQAGGGGAGVISAGDSSSGGCRGVADDAEDAS